MDVPYQTELNALPGGDVIVRSLQAIRETLQGQPFRIGGSYIRQGAGSPQGVVVGTIGDLYLRTDSQAVGAANPTLAVLYVKLTGNGLPTGWALVPTVSAVLPTLSGIGLDLVPFTDGTGQFQYDNGTAIPGNSAFYYDPTGGSGVNPAGTLAAQNLTAAGAQINGTASVVGLKFPLIPVADSSVRVLDDYREGTWTPIDSSGAGLGLTVANAVYVKVGQAVSVSADVTYPVTANGAFALIGGLPFTLGGANWGLIIGFTTSALTALTLLANAGATTLFIYNAGIVLTNAQVSAVRFIFSGTYRASA